MHLIVLVRDERPDLVEKFRAAGVNHEAQGTIDFSGRVPPPDKPLNGRADARPNGVGRTENHFGGENGIDLERSQNGRTAGFLLFWVSTCQPLAREENGLFPCRPIENVRLQIVARYGIADAGQH
jgi:hypothetical protein